MGRREGRAFVGKKFAIDGRTGCAALRAGDKQKFTLCSAPAPGSAANEATMNAISVGAPPHCEPAKPSTSPRDEALAALIA
jgi:hypothetical protein